MLRWKKGDYIKLGKAVANFNRQVSRNTNTQNKQYLPQPIDYKQLKQNIQTRQGLNAYIQGLKRIDMPGGFTLEKLEGGAIVTRYQKAELERGRQQAIKELTRQINKIEQQKIKDLKLKEMSPSLKTDKQKGLETRLQDYVNLFKLSGATFEKRAAEVSLNQTELKYRRAYIFRENYMKVMEEKYSEYENYDLFLEWANKRQNPIIFYEDLPDTKYYPDDLHYQSASNFREDDFNAFLEKLGIDTEQRTEVNNN